MRKFILLAAMVALSSGLAVEDAGAIGALKKSFGNLPTATAIRASGTVKAPYAHKTLCSKNPGACSASGANRIDLTESVWHKLESVNSRVNRSIRSRSDREIHGRSDVWSIGGRFGDCEDYVLAKRQQLRSAGIPSGAMSIAVVRTAGGIGHAVLIVRTDRGDFALDNRRSAIRAWNRTGYRYYKITAPDNGRTWIKVNGGRRI